MIEIIIVSYGEGDVLHECVEQLFKCTDVDYHLTIYDNYPIDDNLSVVWNRLISRSDAEYICLLNPDTVPSKGWLKKMLAIFKQEPKAGMVGPVSNRAGGPQGGWTKAYHQGTYGEIGTMSGFCTVFPKKIWEEVGGFDEQFKLYGEDSNFAMKVKKAGYKLILRHDVFIFHYGESSRKAAEERGKNIIALRREASERFQNSIGEAYSGGDTTPPTQERGSEEVS